MLQDHNPDATCVYEIHRKKDGKKISVVFFYVNFKGKLFAHNTSGV